MYTHPKLRAFTSTLEALFREVDGILEEHYGDFFPLHPNRPRRGCTADPGMDGLFNIGPDFTPGYGSEKGRGYIITLKVSTLEKVPPGQFEAFMEEAASLVRAALPRYFPDRALDVVRDGKHFKITGDFSLGEA